MIPFHSHVAPKQDYLDSIYFHSFPFFYFKTSNQGYLIPFHSIFFHSFPLFKYISFHSFPSNSYDHSIPFLYKLPSGALGGELVQGIFFYRGSVYSIEGCSEDFMYFLFFFIYISLLYTSFLTIFLHTLYFIFIYT